MNFFKRTITLSIAGALAACVVAEYSLRPVSASWHYPAGEIRTIAQYSEGTAQAHFEADGLGTYGNRLTGHRSPPGAKVVTLLGDSHLLQEAVDDTETAGAVIENLARRASKPLQVKQYGWYSAGLAAYLGEAPAIERASPSAVVVVLNEFDFGANELLYSLYWQMGVAPDMTITLRRQPREEERGWRAAVREWSARSSLALAILRRVNLIRSVQADSSGAPAGPRPEEVAAADEAARMQVAAMRGLRERYGSRLLVVYTPWCRPRCTAQPDTAESQLLAACKAERVDCLSVREPMVASEQANHRFHRGFHNTGPGDGHLNRHGLAILGQTIWRHLEPRL